MNINFNDVQSALAKKNPDAVLEQICMIGDKVIAVTDRGMYGIRTGVRLYSYTPRTRTTTKRLGRPKQWMMERQNEDLQNPSGI